MTLLVGGADDGSIGESDTNWCFGFVGCDVVIVGANVMASGSGVCYGCVW